MNAAEMHAFEQAMMDDPMLADAVDGYAAAEKINIQSDLTDLKERMKEKNRKTGIVVKGSFRQWMSIAASLAIIFSLSVVLYRSFNQKENKQTQAVAQLSQKVDTAVSDLPETKIDSAAVAVNDNTNIPVKTARTAPSYKKQEKEEITDKEQVASAANNNSVAATEPPPLKEQPATTAPVASAQSKTSDAAPNELKVAENKKQASLVRLNKFTGQVVDENNQPLPFANVTEVKSGVGTYADVKGNFILVSSDTVLNVETKSVGYFSNSLEIRSNQTQKIVLKDESVIANAPTRERLYEKNKDRQAVMKTDVTEMESEPADGWKNYSTYIVNNLREADLNKRKQSADTKEVEVSFDVNPDGSLANLKIERSNCTTCNNEAIRIIKEGPKWKSNTGKKERTRYTVKF